MRKFGCILVLLLFNVLLISSAKAGTQAAEKSHRSEILQKAFAKSADIETPQGTSGYLILRVQPAPTSFHSVTKGFIAGIISWLTEHPQKELVGNKATDESSLPAQQHLLFIFPFHNFW